MAAIVYQTSKQTGITYAYESVSYWDKEKQLAKITMLPVAPIFAEAIERIYEDKPVSTMFI